MARISAGFEILGGLGLFLPGIEWESVSHFQTAQPLAAGRGFANLLEKDEGGQELEVPGITSACSSSCGMMRRGSRYNQGLTG